MTRRILASYCRLGLVILPALVLLPAGLVSAQNPAPAPAPKPAAAEEVKTPDMWLGLRCQPISNEVREQIRLEPGLGLLIDYVAPGGPAANAGLRSGDVVVAVGERLSRNEQLAQAIARAQAHVVRLQIYRDGRVQAIEVKLAPRPADEPTEVKNPSVVVPAESEKERKVEVRREVRVVPPEAPKPRLPGVPGLPGAPAAPAPPGGAAVPAAPGHAPHIAVLAAPRAALPENMKVTIDKKGGEPALIVVEQDGKTWKATERDLSALPESARPFVNRILGRPAVAVGAAALPGVPGEGAVRSIELKVDGKALPEGAGSFKLVPGGDGKTFELKLEESKLPAEAIKQPSPDRGLREIEEKIQALRQEVERLRKAVKE